MSENNYPKYCTLLKLFYQKLITGHTNETSLSEIFDKIITEEASVSERPSRKKSSFSGSNRTYSNHTKSINNQKHNKNEYIFESDRLQKLILFSYLHNIIMTSNSEAFSNIETMARLRMDTFEERERNNQAKWEQYVKEWKKVMQLLTYKSKVRWEKILATSVNCFEDYFLEILLKCIMNTSANIESIFEVANSYEKSIQQISSFLKVNIKWYEFEKGEIVSQKCYGSFKEELKIGYVKGKSGDNYQYWIKEPSPKNLSGSDELKTEQASTLTAPNSNLLSIETKSASYLTNKSTPPPEKYKPVHLSPTAKSDKASEGNRKSGGLSEGLLKRKNLRCIESLLREYNSNTSKLGSLDCFENGIINRK